MKRLCGIVGWLGLVLSLSLVVSCGSGIKFVSIPISAKAPNLEFFETSSGLRLVIERHKQDALAGAILLVEAGFEYETPASSSIAHTTEHLVFRARPR